MSWWESAVAAVGDVGIGVGVATVATVAVTARLAAVHTGTVVNYSRRWSNALTLR